MVFAKEYSLLLIIIFLKDCSSNRPDLKVAWLKKVAGEDIMIECATDETKQDRMAMFMSKKAASTHQEMFVYQNHSIQIKAFDGKVNVTGKFPKLVVTFFNTTVAHTGLYWCVFNLKKTPARITFVSIETEPKEQLKEEKTELNPECTEFAHLIILFSCASVFPLFIIGFICMALMMKGLWGKRKYKLSNPSPDLVYEDMQWSSLNTKHVERSFANPEYQSNQELR